MMPPFLHVIATQCCNNKSGTLICCNNHNECSDDDDTGSVETHQAVGCMRSEVYCGVLCVCLCVAMSPNKVQMTVC